jgi:type IV pilus assembly protein PilX
MSSGLRAGRDEVGAILIFCLVFLLVLTIMGTASMESTVLEARMAGNMQDYQAAFEAAEIALLAADNVLGGVSLWPPGSANGSTEIWIRDSLDPIETNTIPWWREPVRDTRSWWSENAISVDGSSALSAEPAFVIEEYSVAPVVRIGTQLRTPVFYRITARGTGVNASTIVHLQTTYRKMYDRDEIYTPEGEVPDSEKVGAEESAHFHSQGRVSWRYLN